MAQGVVETRTDFDVKLTTETFSSSGVSRDSTDGKTNYALVYDGPMLNRWAEHLTKGARLHGVRNWMLARAEEDRQRFREGAARHFAQWMNGLRDEDHAAAVFFGINGFEFLKRTPE